MIFSFTQVITETKLQKHHRQIVRTFCTVCFARQPSKSTWPSPGAARPRWSIRVTADGARVLSVAFPLTYTSCVSQIAVLAYSLGNQVLPSEWCILRANSTPAVSFSISYTLCLRKTIYKTSRWVANTVSKLNFWIRGSRRKLVHAQILIKRETEYCST